MPASRNPLVLEIDLGALERGRGVSLEEWRSEDPTLERVGAWGGSALGVAFLRQRLREPPAGPPTLILAVGDGVRRGLPTAARATVLSRAPLSGLLAEGHIGGDLGPALASVTDALVLRGRTSLPCAVLRIARDARARLESRPELARSAPARAIEVLSENGAHAVLTIGPGGERGLPLASLASGFPRPSFVGRGGLGAVLGALGLKAVVLETGLRAERRSEDSQACDAITRALSRSPRLASRSAGGTLELYGALAASDDLRGRDFEERVPPDLGRALDAEGRERRVERKGCRGCPTPCGWVFERSDGARQRAHFGATYALGLNLGLQKLDDALALLERCDALGLDAKEVGGVLALHGLAQERRLRPGPSDLGDRTRLLERIDSLVHGGAECDPLRRGALAYARSLGLEREEVQNQGQAARRDASYASLLGQAVSTGGADPMRSFPFLVGASGRARLQELCADLGPLPRSAEDPRVPAGKGRLVFWHENLVAAVDATGFCAFSTAGLLADGVIDLDQLASWILPRALLEPADRAWRELSPGRRLLAAGANLVLLRREIDRAFDSTRASQPEWARASLAEPGMLDEYSAWRGLDERGTVREDVLACLGTPRVLEQVPRTEAPSVSRSAPADSPLRRAHGRIVLRSSGALGERLGRERWLELDLPASVLEVLDSAEIADPRLRGRLLSRGHPVPAVWRRNQRLAPESEVLAGDVLELVIAISGG